MSSGFAQDDIRAVGDRGWIPYRSLSYRDQDHFVRELRIVEADFTTPPDSAIFRLEFEAPLAIFENSKGILYEPVKSFSFATLPLNKVAKKRAPTGPDQVQPSVAEPQMLGEREKPRSYVVFVTLIAGVVFIVLAGWAYRRRA